jgi:hypothetical protein
VRETSQKHSPITFPRGAPGCAGSIWPAAFGLILVLPIDRDPPGLRFCSALCRSAFPIRLAVRSRIPCRRCDPDRQLKSEHPDPAGHSGPHGSMVMRAWWQNPSVPLPPALQRYLPWVPEGTTRYPGYQIEGNRTGYFLKRRDWRCRL